MLGLKDGIRVIGIDDSPFEKYKKKKEKILVVGVVMRQNIVEGILSTYITKDGEDGTEKIYKMISKSRFFQQIKLILIHGTMLGGLNVIDTITLYEKTKIPIIAITKRKPNIKEVYNALRKANLKTFEKKKKIIERITKESKFKKIKIKGKNIYIQPIGLNEEETRNLLNKLSLEPLRLAHLIGSAIVKGESKGKM